MKKIPNKILAGMLCMAMIFSCILPVVADDAQEDVFATFDESVIEELADTDELVTLDEISEEPAEDTEIEENSELEIEEDTDGEVFVTPIQYTNYQVTGAEGIEINAYPSVRSRISPNNASYAELVSTTNTIDDAAVLYRADLKIHTATFQKYYFVTDKPITDDNAFDFYDELFEKAIAHTGNPTEGDYLQWQISSGAHYIEYAQKDNLYYCCVNAFCNFRSTVEEEQMVDAKVEQIVASLDLRGDLNDYEKIYRIHKYLTENVGYGNLSSNSAYTAYGCLVNEVCACQGYAVSSYRLCLEAGLDNRVIVSYPADHSWNIVKVGNSYYNIDSTWDHGSNWKCFLCGDVPSETNKCMSFRDRHMATNSETGEPYYRPAWVEEYNVSYLEYPCFYDRRELSSSSEVCFYIVPEHNVVTKCVPDANGYCINCGQKVKTHTHVFDQKVEKTEYIVSYGTCITKGTFKYSCVCGDAGTETFVGTTTGYAENTGFSEVGPHGDRNRDGKCDYCHEDFSHYCDKCLSTINAVTPTCTSEGNKKYYKCFECGKLFIRENNEYVEVTKEDVILPMQPHTDKNNDSICDVCSSAVPHTHSFANLTKHEATPPTCTKAGNQEYYSCSCGEKYFTNSSATTETTLQAVTIAPIGHAFGTYVVVTQPKYGIPGEKVATCVRCQAKDYKEIPALTEPPVCDHIDKNDDGICDECNYPAGHIHSTYTLTKHEAVEATCKETGMKEYYSCSCGEKLYTSADMSVEIEAKDLIVPLKEHTFGNWVITKKPTAEAKGERACICQKCAYVKTEELPPLGVPSKKVKVESANNLVAYADGVEVAVDSAGYIELDSYDVKTIVTFEYNSKDTSTNYPVASTMKVYFISKDNENNLTAVHMDAFDGLLQYRGASVRATGAQGIRIITGIPKTSINALNGSGLNGWRLVEYGTLAGNDAALNGASVVIGSPKSTSAKFNSNPFSSDGALNSYTVGITFNSLEQCKVTLSLRPYIKITNGNETLTLYGGIIHRSIGQVAYQNRNAFAPGTTNYNFIWDIIVACYPDKASERK